MYLDTQIEIAPIVIEALVERSHLLDFGGAGSFMTDFEKTMIAMGHPVNALFPGQTLKQITLVGLRPSQQIVAHRDAPILPAVRYHLPLLTNYRCWSFHADSWQQLDVGRVYAMVPTEWHGAVNWGETLRLHLMVDVL